jgi:hypothetical protein
LFSSSANQRILVYVQALPAIIPSSAKKFSDLEATEFRMSHSSKAALAYASKCSQKILAAGFSPILREAVARGAAGVFPMPLCDDPLQQSSFFPKEKVSAVVVGENPDWVFSGMSLAGLLSSKLHFGVQFSSEPESISPESIVVVLDSGEAVSSIDIRRIESSQGVPVHPEGVLGSSVLRRLEESKTETLTGSPEETSSAISRRLRRITSV